MLGVQSKLLFSLFFPLVSLCLSLFSSFASFVSTGAHSCDRMERKNRASHLISAASRVLFSSFCPGSKPSAGSRSSKDGSSLRGLGIFPLLTAHGCVSRLAP